MVQCMPSKETQPTPSSLCQLVIGLLRFGLKNSRLLSCKLDITVPIWQMVVGPLLDAVFSSSQEWTVSWTYGTSSTVKMKSPTHKRSLTHPSLQSQSCNLWLLLVMQRVQCQWWVYADHCTIKHYNQKKRKLWLPSSIENSKERRIWNKQRDRLRWKNQSKRITLSWIRKQRKWIKCFMI